MQIKIMPMDFNTEAIWDKARKCEGLPPDLFRLDACGALIMRDKYGKENPYGWVVDHIYPKSLGGDDNIENLRPLHYKNNISKADDYPSYTAVLKYDGNKGNIENVRNLTVNKRVREILKKLYS